MGLGQPGEQTGPCHPLLSVTVSASASLAGQGVHLLSSPACSEQSPEDTGRRQAALAPALRGSRAWLSGRLKASTSSSRFDGGSAGSQGNVEQGQPARGWPGCSASTAPTSTAALQLWRAWGRTGRERGAGAGRGNRVVLATEWAQKQRPPQPGGSAPFPSMAKLWLARGSGRAHALDPRVRMGRGLRVRQVQHTHPLPSHPPGQKALVG